MRLQILIPHYHETAAEVKPLLDSIAIQQNVDFGELGVVICHDGEDILDFDFPSEIDELDMTEFPVYPFEIKQIHIPHGGVSAARNAALDAATAEYVMFCDADDMFFNACGLYILFREMETGFDSLTSAFIEETRNPEDKSVVYVNHDMDSTFVHGKVHRRKYLLDNSIRWNDALTIHEDSYFNILCQRLSQNVKYCPNPFYLWRWRDESVCRHDPKYILKTYNNMLDSNTSLVDQFLQRGRTPEAQFYAVSMVYDAYYTLNKDEWINQENQTYRKAVEKRFSEYYRRFEILFVGCPQEVRAQVIMGIKNRMFGEGLLMEKQTFDQWIEHIKKL